MMTWHYGGRGQKNEFMLNPVFIMLDPIYKELQWFESDSPWVFVLQIKNSYFLVSVVDNDYIHGDLFSVFAAL